LDNSKLVILNCLAAVIITTDSFGVKERGISMIFIIITIKTFLYKERNPF
jgi:hypothetical protein